MRCYLVKVIRNLFLPSRNYFATTIVHSFDLQYKLSPMNSKKLPGGNWNNLKTMGTKHGNMIDEMKISISKKYDVTFEEIPLKSETDKNEYLVMKLKNGLKVLLISDVEHLVDLSSSTNFSAEIIHSSDKNMSKKSEKLAACSLTVGVGSFSDPEEIPGLAHFVEHMLFMGSKKFPKENDFYSYLKKRGGSSNAFTDNEITSFYFTCPDKHLQEIMERFSNFFISPLMNKDSMKREREVVDSEFYQNPSFDFDRIDQIFYSIAPLNNPAHKFSWGNLITLKENVEDDELHKSLREFWENNYSANLMTVTVQARLPLDIIGKLVAKYFGEIKSNNEPPITFPDLNPPFNMDLFHKIYTIMPVEDIDHLILTWALPSVKHLYKSKPLSYFIFLIGHKGEGSLFSYLHEKMWIMDLTASCRNTESNSIYSMLSIDFSLTEAGLENYEEIITLVFSYIILLNHKGPSKRIYKECQNIEDLKFRFKVEIEASDYVEELSCNMQLYPPEHYITGDKLLLKYQPDEITNILKLLNPNKINIMILSKSAAEKVTLDKTEYWFQTKYHTKNISKELIRKWKTCELNSKLKFPKPNIYIPENFDIIQTHGDQLSLHPKTISKNNSIEVWYKPDSKFKLPYGYVAIYLISPATVTLPQNSVMCDFLQQLFNYLLINESYPASLAGFDFSLSSAYSGLILVIDGFDDKIVLLLERVLKNMMEFVRNKNIPQHSFRVIKEQLRKDYYNYTLDASELANELFSSILWTNYWDSVSRLKVIDVITIEKLQEFMVNFFEKLYIKTLIQGNISTEKAVNISNLIIHLIDCKAIVTETYPQLRTRLLPVGKNIIRIQSFNPVDTTINVTNYYQYGQCPVTDKCLLLMLLFIMEEPLFDTLRTKEKLAYNANCQFKDTKGITGFTVSVISQAHKFSVEHVENQITRFLNSFVKDIENMTDEDFYRNKESFKTLLLVDDANLSQEFERNWEEIVSDEYMFDRIEKYITCIEKITPFSLKRTVNRVIGKTAHGKTDSSLIRKLSIQIDGERNDEGGKETKNYTSDVKHSFQIKSFGNINDNDKFIKNIDEFKRTMKIHPKSKRIKNILTKLKTSKLF